MTSRRGFFAGLLACLCPWTVRARNEEPGWTAIAWVLALPCGRGYVEGKVWLDDVEQCYEWSALRVGQGRPAGPQWRTGRCKMAKEAQAAARAAIEELQK